MLLLAMSSWDIASSSWDSVYRLFDASCIAQDSNASELVHLGADSAEQDQCQTLQSAHLLKCIPQPAESSYIMLRLNRRYESVPSAFQEAFMPQMRG